MGWTRRPARVARDRCQPRLEGLEPRQLLSTLGARPAASPASLTNPDGTTNFDRIIGASAARSAYHVDGSGMSVAVIDTGVNYTNPALGGGIGIGTKVIAGVDFTGSPDGILPAWQHGTGVAGLVASNTPTYKGVAPGAEIVALRVFGDQDQGSFAGIEQALDWVVHHHAEYAITAVNLSISDGGNYTSNGFAQDGSIGQAITRSIRQLDDLNIPVVVAAGNSFDGKSQGQAFPAIVADAVSVTATDASGRLAANAQRLGAARGHGSATTLSAPGVGVPGPADGSSFRSEDGTSFAAPQVTGSIVLLQQMYRNAFHQLPSVAQLEGWLRSGAVTVHDRATGIDVGRLDILNSARILDRQIAGVVKANAVASTPTGVAPSPPTVPASPPAAPTPRAEHRTEVFGDGKAIGTFPTSRPAARHAHLVKLLKGSPGSMISGLRNATPMLGRSRPSGTIGTQARSAQAPASRARAGSLGVVHAMVLRTSGHDGHPRAAPHRPSAISRPVFRPRS